MDAFTCHKNLLGHKSDNCLCKIEILHPAHLSLRMATEIQSKLVDRVNTYYEQTLHIVCKLYLFLLVKSSEKLSTISTNPL